MVETRERAAQRRRVGAWVLVPAALLVAVGALVAGTRRHDIRVTLVGLGTLLGAVAAIWSNPALQRGGMRAERAMVALALVPCAVAAAWIFLGPVPWWVGGAAAGATLAILVMSNEPEPGDARTMIGLVIVVGLLLHVPLAFPWGIDGPPVGIDPWFHDSFRELIVTSGSVPTGQLYSGMPGYHLVGATLEMLSGWGEREGSLIGLLTATLPALITSAFIYLIATDSLGLSRRVALLSAACFVTFDWSVGWTTFATASTMSLLLAAAILWLSLRRPTPATLGLLVVLMTALVFVHILTTLVIAALLIGVGLASRATTGRAGYQTTLGVALFVGASSLYIAKSAFILRYAVLLIQNFGQLNRFTNAAESNAYIATIPGTEAVLAGAGLAAVACLSILGLSDLFTGEARNLARSRVVIPMLFIVGALGAVSAGTNVVKVGALGPDRWFVYFYALGGTILCAIAVSRLAASGTHARAAMAMAAFALGLVMVGTPVASVTGGGVAPHLAVGYDTTPAELRAVDFAANNTTGGFPEQSRIYVDYGLTYVADHEARFNKTAVERTIEITNWLNGKADASKLAEERPALGSHAVVVLRTRVVDGQLPYFGSEGTFGPPRDGLRTTLDSRASEQRVYDSGYAVVWRH